MSTITQSLAGRTALFTLLPLSFDEMTDDMKNVNVERMMVHGFYPGVIVDGINPKVFYDNYYDTYVERDLRDLLKVSNLLKFDTFVRMMALRVGSEFNASALSREVGVSAVTISGWLSLLLTSYIVFELPPYFNNPGKRLTKNKKIYFHDTGLLCNLLSINDPSALVTNPMRGAIFENLAVSALVKKSLIGNNRPNLYFYRENRGIEVDVVEPTATGGLNLYEIKAGKTLHPDYAANMKKLSSTLKIQTQPTVIYDGETIGNIAVNIRDI